MTVVRGGSWGNDTGPFGQRAVTGSTGPTATTGFISCGTHDSLTTNVGEIAAVRQRESMRWASYLAARIIENLPPEATGEKI